MLRSESDSTSGCSARSKRVAEGASLRCSAPKLRALLAIMLLHASEEVPSDRLVEDLWAGRPPATAPKLLQGYVSRLRKALGEGRS